TRTKIEVIGTTHPTAGVKRLVKAVVRGLNACQEPEASVDGLGGTYFFMNELGDRAAIVKPCDEEPLAPNNPKGFVGRALGEPGLKPTVRVGEAALREVAAFLLDYGSFAGVPNTVLVRVRHPIFHQAASATGEADLGSSMGEALEPPYFEWLHWPQASMPFDEDELEYVRRLEPKQDVELLRRELPALREESLRTLEVSSTLLKLCCAAGLTLSEIATVISRPLVGMEEEPSELEKLCAQTRQEVDELTPEDIELATMSSRDEEDASSPDAAWGPDDMHDSLTNRSSSLLSHLDSGMSITSPGEEQGAISAKRLGSARRSGLHRYGGGDDLLFDLEEGPEDGDAPDATLTSFTGSMSKPLSLSYSSSPEQQPSPMNTPQRKQLGMPNQGDSLFSVGSYQDSQDSARTTFSSIQPPVLASSAVHGGRWPGQGPSGRRQPVRSRKHGARLRSHGLRPRKQVYPPHIQGGAPSSTNAIFSDMDGQQWSCFMEILTDLIEGTLENGKWRQSSSTSSSSMPVGMSCPRF
ncbi:hypothetical protein WJX84_006171, partial [Apatococcus fuscideae]